MRDSSDSTRRLIAVLLVVLYAVVAVVSIKEPLAGSVFDMMQPVMFLILGYYFGREAEQRQK
jgi:hypothetical protein